MGFACENQGVTVDNDDRALVEACLQEDQAAWKRLVQEFTPWVCGVVRLTLGRWGVRFQAHDVDDLCANVFHELLARDRATLKSFGPPWRLEPWLAVIARRACVRAFRRAAPETVALGRSDPPAEERPVVERDNALASMLEALDPEDRAILELYYVQERGHEEVSSILGIPMNTLRKRKSRIIQHLQGMPQFRVLRDLLS